MWIMREREGAGWKGVKDKEKKRKEKKKTEKRNKNCEKRKEMKKIWDKNGLFGKRVCVF